MTKSLLQWLHLSAESGGVVAARTHHTRTEFIGFENVLDVHTGVVCADAAMDYDNGQILWLVAATAPICTMQHPQSLKMSLKSMQPCSMSPWSGGQVAVD